MSWFVADPADNGVIFKIVFDSISLVNIWMWESDGSGIVSNNVWNLVRTNSFFDNLAKLEAGFWTFNADEGESALFIIQKSIVFTSLDDSEEIHKTNWEFGISSNLVVDFESCLFILGDNGDLSAVSC